MSGPCSREFVRLADELGGISCDADPVLTLRAPWDLANGTLPVVEALIIVGAGLALAHAISMLRRGQPAWLGLWVASVVYVLVIEPPLYFPETFGLEESVGLVFAHNTFSVEMLYDRLPLYIVALYPAGIYLAHALVDRLGVFRRHGILIGALTVGVVHHLFYEIFDQLGPQLRWWAWNPDPDVNAPFFASVPLTSVVIFATLSPAALVALARWLLFRDGDGRSTGSWVWRTAAVGLGTVVLQPVLGLPATLVGALDGDGTMADQVALWTPVIAMAAVAAWAVLTSEPVEDAGARPSSRWPCRWLDRYPALYALAYLATFTALWLTALPDLVDATGGRTADGTPTGNPLYALACGVVILALVLRTLGRASAPTDPGGAGEPATATSLASGTAPSEPVDRAPIRVDPGA